MARTIAEIQAAIIAEKEANATLSGLLTSTSKVAIWRLWTYVTAVGIWTLEVLFDSHKVEVQGIIAEQKTHTLPWYVGKAKAFQYGETLPADTDVYEVVPPEDESVLIVSSAAAVELTALNRVRIKVAKGDAGALAALSSGELAAFSTYMGRIKDAGVRLECTSAVGDDLKLALEIYYDPLVLSAIGERLDGTDDEPVKGGINAFLANIPFNGLFVLNDLIDAIEAVEGVVICHVVSCEANYAATPYVPIPVRYVPDAGYLVLNEVYFDAEIVYIPN